MRLNRDQSSLILLLAMPVAIIVAATFVYITGVGLPRGTANHGELISPPRKLQAAGIPFAAPSSTGRPVWTLLQIVPAACDKTCADNLLYSRQLRTSLGRRTPGLRRLLWLPAANPLPPALAAAHADLQLAQLPRPTQLAALFNGAEAAAGQRYYLIDPHGFMMMYYTAHHDYKQISKDLKFLLTRSGY